MVLATCLVYRQAQSIGRLYDRLCTTGSCFKTTQRKLRQSDCVTPQAHAGLRHALTGCKAVTLSKREGGKHKQGGTANAGESEAPSEYMGRSTTHPKGSPASILLATLRANSTGIRWLAFPAAVPPCPCVTSHSSPQMLHPVTLTLTDAARNGCMQRGFKGLYPRHCTKAVITSLQPLVQVERMLSCGF